jgi:hypothetical protein
MNCHMQCVMLHAICLQDNSTVCPGNCALRVAYRETDTVLAAALDMLT